MPVQVSRADVIAFRLAAHHLTDRLDDQFLPTAAGACGIQDSPPGSALLALHARVRNLTQDRLHRAVAEDKVLLQSWCMRGAPYCFPTSDAPVFTAGLLPPTEQAMRQLILGVGPAVDELGLSLTETVALLDVQIGAVLSDRRLAIDELGKELAAAVTDKLSTRQRAIWIHEGPYAAGQPLGEAVVHFCLRILTLQGVVCFAPRVGNKAPFVLVDEWLGRPIQEIDPGTARTELLRRYLHCYGPSTKADFAAWLGVRAGDASPWWDLVETELTQVDVGRRAWVLTKDLESLQSPREPHGVRLLPPRDPYTQLRDRDTIVDRQHHREIWQTVGDPGTILVDGTIAGTWRPRKSGHHLTITVRPFGSLSDQDRSRLQAEAELIAPLRSASSVDVRVDGP